MVKENDGKATWRRRRCFVGVLCFSIWVVGCTMLKISFERKKDGFDSSIQPSGVFSDMSDTDHPKVRAILEGKYHLVEIGMSYGSLLAEASNKNATPAYNGVTATFCPINWELQKSNPSLVPMYRELISQEDCERNKFTINMREISQKVRSYDESITNKNAGASRVKQLELGGAVFHESRCGSTLVANLLSASNPQAHRVYSESHPPTTVLKACTLSPSHCSREKQAKLLRDVVYLMSRSASREETHVFFKIQSIGVYNIPTFAKIFPDTPWIFVYRDSVEVLASQLKHLDNTASAACLRSRRRPLKVVHKLVEHHGKTVSDLTNVEFCAAHVGTMCKAALEGLELPSSKGRAVNYATLPDAIWETILPQHFEIMFSEDAESMVKRMKALSQVYSKGFREKANKEWVEDSERKQERATSAIRAAAEMLIQPYFEQLELYNLGKLGDTNGLNNKDDSKGDVQSGNDIISIR